jgi:hypothetical protein
VVEIADHQLQDLRVVASIIRVIRVGFDGFEVNGASLALLSLVNKGFEKILSTSSHTFNVFVFIAVLKYSECAPMISLWTLKRYGPQTIVQSKCSSLLK